MASDAGSQWSAQLLTHRFVSNNATATTTTTTTTTTTSANANGIRRAHTTCLNSNLQASGVLLRAQQSAAQPPPPQQQAPLQQQQQQQQQQLATSALGNPAAPQGPLSPCSSAAPREADAAWRPAEGCVDCTAADSTVPARLAVKRGSQQQQALLQALTTSAWSTMLRVPRLQPKSVDWVETSAASSPALCAGVAAATQLRTASSDAAAGAGGGPQQLHSSARDALCEINPNLLAATAAAVAAGLPTLLRLHSTPMTFPCQSQLPNSPASPTTTQQPFSDRHRHGHGAATPIAPANPTASPSTGAPTARWAGLSTPAGSWRASLSPLSGAASIVTSRSSTTADPVSVAQLSGSGHPASCGSTAYGGRMGSLQLTGATSAATDAVASSGAMGRILNIALVNVGGPSCRARRGASFAHLLPDWQEPPVVGAASDSREHTPPATVPGGELLTTAVGGQRSRLRPFVDVPDPDHNAPVSPLPSSERPADPLCGGLAAAMGREAGPAAGAPRCDGEAQQPAAPAVPQALLCDLAVGGVAAAPLVGTSTLLASVRPPPPRQPMPGGPSSAPFAPTLPCPWSEIGGEIRVGPPVADAEVAAPVTLVLVQQTMPLEVGRPQGLLFTATSREGGQEHPGSSGGSQLGLKLASVQTGPRVGLLGPAFESIGAEVAADKGGTPAAGALDDGRVLSAGSAVACSSGGLGGCGAAAPVVGPPLLPQPRTTVPPELTLAVPSVDGVSTLRMTPKRTSLGLRTRLFATGAAGVSAVAAGVPPSAVLPVQQRRLPQEQEAPHEERWHEVTFISFQHPQLQRRVIVVTQNDVSPRIWAEQQLALVMEAEHTLLENIFPHHVIEHIAQAAAEELEPRRQRQRQRQQQPQQLSGSVTGAADREPDEGDSAADTAWLPPIRGETFLHLATSHAAITILFCDIQGFTPMCGQLGPIVVMSFLNNLFTRLDGLLDEFGVYKVETIGDCYVAAGGLMTADGETGAVSVRSTDVDPQHAYRTVQFAKALLRAASRVSLPTTGLPVRLRVGIHSGPAMSGVVGTRMPRFCLFGDTMNVASRMESTGEAGAIHVSQATRDLVPSEAWECRGGVEVKGKGRMDTYLLRGGNSKSL